MQKARLPNGIKVIYEQKKNNAVVIQVMVNVGSNNEKLTERGISHFLEHLLFEGTTKRPTNLEITNEIEKIGGDFNAYTTNERTCYYINVLKKHSHVAMDVLADILQNPLFLHEHVEKEKNIILKEVAMIYDEPRFYQWILLQQHLFADHPSGNPTFGEKKVIRVLTRENIKAFYEKYYSAQNITISIVGDVPNWKKQVASRFVLQKGTKTKQISPAKKKLQKKIVRREKRNIANTYMVLGFRAVPRSHKDSYVLEVINGILGRGQSGRMFTQIRSNLGLAYDVGTQLVSEVTFGYFGIYASIDRKNVSVVKKVILEELNKLKKISDKGLQEAKTFVEGSYMLELEDSQKVADQLLFWEQVKDARLMKTFVKNIRKVSKNDVKRVVDTYFKNHALVVLEGK